MSRSTSAAPTGIYATDHSEETPHALRHATLRAAYRRINQVRESLSLLEPAESYGPSHDAILLSGASPAPPSDETIDLAALRTNLPLSTMDRLRQYEQSQVFEGEGDRPARQLHQLDTTVSDLSSTIRQQNIARRSILESQLIRRRDLGSSDDGSTFLGRHVAAREAANSSSPGSAASSSSSQNRIANRYSAAEREIENFRLLARQRRSEPVRTNRADSEYLLALRQAERLTARSLDINSARGPVTNGQMTTSPTTIRGPSNPRTTRLRSSRQPSTPSSGSTNLERLSLLSNFSSVQNLSTPTSAARPLLFEEPTSYINPPSPSTRLIDEHESRAYSIRRTINLDGEEVVHNINLDWEDDDSLAPWLIPPLPPNLPRSARSNFRGNNDLGSREGRSWARLDLDGNEIPSDEEVELEQQRTLDRLRQRNRARILIPLSRNSFAPEYSFDEISPIVRLNSRETRLAASIPEFFGTNVPYKPDPLPMPLAEMLPRCRKTSLPPKSLAVHKNAVLAGR
ncbi:hypothetical protein C8J56DRAFT_291507 [Mycena floridula]|nr:hypothetical protein C8J56DRAFT_291507 [Mycena floridula]